MSNAVPAQSDIRYETSAAWAEAEASNTEIAHQVDDNAQKLHNAAEDAALKAQHKSPAAAVDHLERGLSDTTDAAAAEGASNVQSYAAQAKGLANSAVNTAQSYLPSNFTSTAGAAATTTKEYLVAAQNAAAPVASNAYNTGLAALQTATTTAAPYVQSATETVSRTLSGTAAASTQAEAPSSASVPAGGVPPKTAPLESGQHVVNSPYPQTTTGQSTKVGEL
ncbi:unnamed protein product [Somion occarium]|uniref:Uncharacterized protein n=1 Tax=Somion occarium TaxID=3059160 RepID=A0ABP1CH19_9APHY